MTMESEELDVVDRGNRVVGQRSRGEVHRLGLLHRAVHILVFNDRGDLFLQKRSQLKDSHPGKWDSSAAGHVEAGEGDEDSAVRELAEELGVIDSPPLEPLFQVAACADTGNEFVTVYACRHEGPFCLPVDEIEHGEWVAPDVVTKWVRDRPDDFASGFRLIWEEFCKSDDRH